MMLTFKAQKMIDKCMAEGKKDMLDEETLAFIRSMDGKKANTYNWRNRVYGEEVALIEGTDTYVPICACE